MYSMPSPSRPTKSHYGAAEGVESALLKPLRAALAVRIGMVAMLMPI